MTTLPIPVYSIYDRNIPRQHISTCVIVNPIASADRIRDGRKECDKAVAACEGDRCALSTQRNGMAK